MIAKRLFNELFYRNARFIYCYASFKDEVCTGKIIEESLRQGKKVALPRVSGERKMEFFFINSPADLKPGFMGIKVQMGELAASMLTENSTAPLTHAMIRLQPRPRCIS